MPGGGLVQIAVYGTQDIFLTGTPQITFFKMVYRRYTNFAIEPLRQYFYGATNFGFESSCIIDKAGDLMSKVYLVVELPRVDLLKNPSNYSLSQPIAQNQFAQIEAYYQMVYAYTSVNTDITRKLGLLCRTNNIPMTEIVSNMNDPLFIGTLVAQREALQLYITENPNFATIVEFQGRHFDMVQQINHIDIQILFNSIVGQMERFGPKNILEADLLIRRETLRLIVQAFYPAIKDFYMQAYTVYLTKHKIVRAYLDRQYIERYKFAWVEEIGHAIIDRLDIRIGSQTIDRHTGDWMVLYNKIFLNQYQRHNYYRMIGNVPELTTFDDCFKKKYRLVIPLRFWFCRNYGLSLPLVALRYHDIMFSLLFKDLSKLAFVEDNPTLLDMPNIQSLYNLNIIDAYLYVDYVYLDSDERRRFAQSTHEYLIEIVQYDEFHNIVGAKYNAHLTFAHPTKFIIWFCQPNQYRHNPTGRNKCQWNNFGTCPDKTGYTLKRTYLRLNSYERTDTTINIKYFNYVQPYFYFAHSPTDGFYVYSFAINPMEHQPSSTCNMSRIDDLGIEMIFTNNFIELVEQNNVPTIPTGAYIASYVMSYNILRIMSGMAGLAFQTST